MMTNPSLNDGDVTITTHETGVVIRIKQGGDSSNI